ncbi:MAG: hypothetical protein EXQ91_09355 [Alphaproteobacteria bacterium]|nr:hypothetical protein [Alphaproteobacteria bacterium]
MPTAINHAYDSAELAYAADVMIKDQMWVKPGQSVIVTADTVTDPVGVDAVLRAVTRAGAKGGVFTIPQLPFQGMLADPYVPDSLGAAVAKSDAWIDLTFPYLAGSHIHDEALKGGRVRYLLALDIGAGGIVRLYGRANLDKIFAVQKTLDTLMMKSRGKKCRITTELGTDVEFILDKPGYTKPRRATKPGLYSPPGGSVMFPVPDSVKGTIVVEAAFHEYYSVFDKPCVLAVNGRIQKISGGGPERRVMDRALRRAGGGRYGYVIHFTHGMHPAARLTHTSFEEATRVAGNDAIGLGTPFWMPGGGENHPDGLMSMQSIWLDGQRIVRDGEIIGPPKLARLAAELTPTHRS